MNENAAENSLLIPSRQPLPKVGDKEVLTYSTINKFRNCPRAMDLRYQHQLAGQRGEALYLGSLVHDGLEAYGLSMMDTAGDESHRKALARDACTEKIDAECEGHYGDPVKHNRWHHALAMCEAYFTRWTHAHSDPLGEVMDNEFDLLAVEKEFTAQITNPKTGAPSRTFIAAGKVDGVVRLKTDGRLYILERKTAASVDGGYLAKLWADFQSMLYAHYLSGIYGEQFGGVLYDVIGKKKHKQRLAESEHDFEIRVAEERKKTRARILEQGPKAGESDDDFAKRLAGYKTDKTREKHLDIGPKKGEAQADFELRITEAEDNREESIRERGPVEGESDEDFHERLMGAYNDKETMTRQLITFDAERLKLIEHEVWDITQQILSARSRGLFTMNTSQCYTFGRPCDFVEVCKSGRLDQITMSGLEHRRPHSELDIVSGFNEANVDDADSGAKDPFGGTWPPF